MIKKIFAKYDYTTVQLSLSGIYSLKEFLITKAIIAYRATNKFAKNGEYTCILVAFLLLFLLFLQLFCL